MRHFEIIDNYTASAKLNKNTPLVITYTKRSNHVSMELVKNLGMNTICQFYYTSKSTGDYVEFPLPHDRGKDAKRGTFIKVGDKFFLEHNEPCFYI